THVRAARTSTMSTPAGMQEVAVVIIDDEESHRELMRAAFERLQQEGQGYFHVRCFADAGEALAELPPAGPVVIFCDYQLRDCSGLDWLTDLVQANEGPVILVTSSGDQQIAAEAFRRGASDYLEKSVFVEHPEQVATAVRESLRRHKLEQVNRDLAKRLKLANAEL